MSGAILSWELCTAVAAGACAVYLLLPIDGDLSGGLRRNLAGALAAVSVLLLALFVGKPVAWWNALHETPASKTVLFWMLASCVLIAAAAVITSGSITRALQAYGLLAAAHAGLFLLLGAVYLSMAMLLLLGTGFTLYLVLSSRVQVEGQLGGSVSVPPGSKSHDNGREQCREPFLACLAGALLCATLIGTIHYSLRTEANRSGRDQRLSATPKLALIESTRRASAGQKSSTSGETEVRSADAAVVRRNWTVAATTAALLLAGIVGVVTIARRAQLASSSDDLDH